MSPAPIDRPGPLHRAGLLYPYHYALYLAAATLDILVTHFILDALDGREVNALANHLIDVMGVWGLVALKYLSVVVVVLVCEFVGRRRPRVGRFLALAAILTSALPVGFGLLQIFVWVRGAL